MPRNTSLPIITGREKGVKMRGFKPFLVELKKKKKAILCKNYKSI